MKLGQKSVKNLVGFLEDLKTPKFHSEINWPLEEEVSRERSSKPRQFKNDTHTSIIMSTLQKVTDYKRSQNTNTYLHKCISRQSVVIQGVPYARIISKTSISWFSKNGKIIEFYYFARKNTMKQLSNAGDLSFGRISKFFTMVEISGRKFWNICTFKWIN